MHNWRMRFAFKLAAHLGKTVSELVASLDAYEWSCWEAIYCTELLGDDREDLRAGIICSTIGNFAGAIAKESLRPSDFISDFWEPEQTPEEIAIQVERAMTAHMTGRQQ